MVQVREAYPTLPDGAIDIDRWLERVNFSCSPEQSNLLADACALCLLGHTKKQYPFGHSPLEKGLSMAEILAGLNMDAYTLAAGILFYSVSHELVALPKIKDKLGSQVEHLVDGTLKMDAIRALHQNQLAVEDRHAHMDKLRKMLISMVDDVRVVLIKLAEQLCFLHTAKDLDPEAQLIAGRETLDIYAPLANRLGIGSLKWELEDYAFRYLNPDNYKMIAKNLDERRVDREKYVNNVIQLIQAQLHQVDVQAEISGRAKHIFSIWRKMQRKNVGFEEIYDVRAVRILVNKIADCYTVLGIVHGLWQHIPKEFDDYVATPKENGYRSIHTAVIGPDGKALEIQIRTYDMHQESEMGVAAHWKYKEGGAEGSTSSFDGKIEWLRQLLEWQEQIADSTELYETFKNEVVDDRIYVFTPQGAVIDLPMGATPLDFAYSVHTEVGHKCVGAKVNTHMVPLTTKLQTGQQVEILTSKNAKPSRDWLNPQHGYIGSSKARSKIHQWFRLQDKEENLLEGKQLFDKAMKRQGLHLDDMQSLAKQFNYKKVDDLYAGIGAGDLRLHQVVNSAQYLLDVAGGKQAVEIKPVIREAQSDKLKHKGISVQGVGNLLTKMAKCCKPVAGDPITGFISQSRGVIIHRSDCPDMLHASHEQPERLINVDWGDEQQSIYMVDLYIQAHDRQGLLRDITTLLANEKVNVVGLNTIVNKKSYATDISIQLEIANSEALSGLLSKINQLPNVAKVERRG